MHKRRRIRQRLDNDFVFRSRMPSRFENNPEHELADTISLDGLYTKICTLHRISLPVERYSLGLTAWMQTLLFYKVVILLDVFLFLYSIVFTTFY